MGAEGQESYLIAVFKVFVAEKAIQGFYVFGVSRVIKDFLSELKDFSRFSFLFGFFSNLKTLADLILKFLFLP